MKSLSSPHFPSVTEVFGHYLPKFIPAANLDYAADRGTRVHSFALRWAIGAFIPGQVDDDCLGYVMSYQFWHRAYVKEVFWIEKELVDEDYGYIGHPDIGLELVDGTRAILDLKTPIQLQRVWAGQLAAYKRLAEVSGEQFDAVGTLRLNPHGGPATMMWYQDSPRDLAAFISLLTGYKYFFHE